MVATVRRDVKIVCVAEPFDAFYREIAFEVYLNLF